MIETIVTCDKCKEKRIIRGNVGNITKTLKNKGYIIDGSLCICKNCQVKEKGYSNIIYVTTECGKKMKVNKKYLIK